MTSLDQLPPSVLAFATMIRDAFGPGVKLKHASDEATGQQWGNAAYDEPPKETP